LDLLIRFEKAAFAKGQEEVETEVLINDATSEWYEPEMGCKFLNQVVWAQSSFW
jgi:hypothetical protein